MKTDRQRIIDFLTKHPDWVDAYRTTNPDSWVLLKWLSLFSKPYIDATYEFKPTSKVADRSRFVLPPEGEWRPLPEPETFELYMIPHTETELRSFGNLVGDFYRAKSTYRTLQADARFAGHKVKVTIEAIQ